MPLVLGGGPKCKKCGKTVYKAEEVISEAGIFHKQCFRCSACNKGLDSFTLTIHNENLFCKSCYGKNFGPSGYGFGGGGAGLMASEKTGPYVPKSAPQKTAPIAQAENGHIQSGETFILQQIFLCLVNYQLVTKLFSKSSCAAQDR